MSLLLEGGSVFNYQNSGDTIKVDQFSAIKWITFRLTKTFGRRWVYSCSSCAYGKRKAQEDNQKYRILFRGRISGSSSLSRQRVS